MTNMRTPLKKVVGLGSARNGTRHFWHQRLTAFFNIPLSLFFVGLIAFLSKADYQRAHQIVSSPIINIFLFLMLFFSIYHMKLGMQIVIEDYVHGNLLRVLCLFLNVFFCFITGAFCLFALLKLGLGG